MNTLPLEMISHILTFCDKSSLISCITVDKTMSACVSRLDIALIMIDEKLSKYKLNKYGKKNPMNHQHISGRIRCQVNTINGTHCNKYAVLGSVYYSLDDDSNKRLHLCNAHGKVPYLSRKDKVIRKISLKSNISKDLLKSRYISKVPVYKGKNLLTMFNDVS